MYPHTQGVCAAAQASGISEAQLLAVLSPPESQEGPESEGVLDPSEEAAEGERDHWVAPGEGGDGNEEVVEVGPEEEAAPRPHYVHPAGVLRAVGAKAWAGRQGKRAKGKEGAG